MKGLEHETARNSTNSGRSCPLQGHRHTGVPLTLLHRRSSKLWVLSLTQNLTFWTCGHSGLPEDNAGKS